LEHGPCSGLLGELCVDYLIGPIAQVAGLWHPKQHVRSADPAVFAEFRLHDRICSGAHGGDGAVTYRGAFRGIEWVRGGRLAIIAPQLNHVKAACVQVLDVRPLVDKASFPQKIERRIPPDGRTTPAFSDSTVELGQVPARKMVRNVRRRKAEKRSVYVHASQFPPKFECAEPE